MRHGYVVFEEYYSGFSAASYHSVKSVTKSVISALIGIALRDGLLSGVDQAAETHRCDVQDVGFEIRVERRG